MDEDGILLTEPMLPEALREASEGRAAFFPELSAAPKVKLMLPPARMRDSVGYMPSCEAAPAELLSFETSIT